MPRCNFGSNNCDRAAAVVKELRQKGAVRADFLHHGVSQADHGGWCSFADRESFRKHLDALAELERRGEIVVTDYSGMASACALKAKAWPRHGVLSLSFDDANFDQWEAALPIFAKYDARTTFFVIGTNRIDFMKKALSAGHEIGMHGLNHRNAPSTGSERDEEWFWKVHVAPQLAALGKAGISVRSYAYPNCRRTDRTDALFFSQGFPASADLERRSRQIRTRTIPGARNSTSGARWLLPTAIFCPLSNFSRRGSCQTSSWAKTTIPTSTTFCVRWRAQESAERRSLSSRTAFPPERRASA